MSKTARNQTPESTPSAGQQALPVSVGSASRRDFDRDRVNQKIDEALTALGEAKMKLPINLAHELQHAHDHLLNARDWVKIYSPNIKAEDRRP